MSRKNADESWLRDLDTEELRRARKYVEDCGFWAYVDSQANAHPHPGACRTKINGAGHQWVDCSDWTHVRGERCIAANSQLVQCGQQPLDGLPFCYFHFGRAWLAMRAIVSEEREDANRRDLEFERSWRYGRYEIDAAMVRDAKRALATQSERVYFYLVEPFIKIGRSINPEVRVKTLGGTLAPDGIDVRVGRLVGTIPGGHHVEHELHEQLRPHRVVGEWFHATPEVLDHIDSLLAEEAAA